MAWMPRAVPTWDFPVRSPLGLNQWRFNGSPADQHDILGGVHELAAMKLANPGFTDFAGDEVEAGQILVCRE